MRECAGLEWRLWTSQDRVTPFFLFPFAFPPSPNEKRFYHLRKKIFFSSSSLTLLAVVVDDASSHPQGSPFAGGETLTDR